MKVTAYRHVWSTNITYIRTGKGFMYLYAILDVYSRYVVDWGLYSTMEASTALEVLHAAVELYRESRSVNSDKGSQYTCQQWLDALKALDIKTSMDG